jgi:plasmid stabilization system protein ParE
VIRPVRWSTQALNDLTDQLACIAAENLRTARRVAAAIDRVALDLGDMPTGRPGRVVGTYEKSVTGLPYTVAYVLTKHDRVDMVAIVRVIHTSRDWTAEEWPQ